MKAGGSAKQTPPVLLLMDCTHLCEQQRLKEVIQSVSTHPSFLLCSDERCFFFANLNSHRNACLFGLLVRSSS